VTQGHTKIFKSASRDIITRQKLNIAIEAGAAQHERIAVKVTLVEYGAGNLPSVERALHRLGVESTRAAAPEEISSARALILPGVGHYAALIRALDEQGLRQAVVLPAEAVGVFVETALVERLSADAAGEQPKWQGPFATIETAAFSIGRLAAAELINKHAAHVEYYKLTEAHELYGLNTARIKCGRRSRSSSRNSSKPKSG
jgi:hypothetical protein